MEQMRQNEAGALTAQAVPQKDVEQACFHALGLIGRNCEYLDQHLAHVGADQHCGGKAGPHCERSDVAAGFSAH